MVIRSLYLYGDEDLEFKFIRINNDFYLDDSQDLDLPYSELVKKEKIEEKIERTREVAIDELDGGIIFIKGKSMRIGSVAEELNIPKSSRARGITIQRLKVERPDYLVKELMDD